MREIGGLMGRLLLIGMLASFLLSSCSSAEAVQEGRALIETSDAGLVRTQNAASIETVLAEVYQKTLEYELALIPSPTAILTLSPTETPTLTPTATPTVLMDSLLPILEKYDCLPRVTSVQKGTVTNVIDGDTVDVLLDDGTTAPVRYIGIDAPEQGMVHYEESLRLNSDLVLNKEVVLISDVSDTDFFNRLLRYVIVGDIFINAELVNGGMAVAEDYPPDSACAPMLAAAMIPSRSSQIGIWEATPTLEPSGTTVTIIGVNKQAEFVDIQNQGITDVDLSGWNLVSVTGNQSCSLSGVIKVGETLRIHAMNSPDGTGYSCGHSGNIWNNSKPDPAVLYNSSGVEVSRKVQ